MNLSNASASNSSIILYNKPLAYAKLSFGALNLFIFVPGMFALPTCTSIGYSSRLFLTMLYSLYVIEYTVLTFYSPLVASGVIRNQHDELTEKLIGGLFLLSLYGLHFGQTVMAADRLLSIQWPLLHAKVFSPRGTKLAIAAVYFYGLAFALPSYFECCFIIYDPLKQVWFYPNDKPKNYRQISGLTSSWGNSAISGVIYIQLLVCLNKLRVKIADVDMRRHNFKKQLSLAVLFAFPWFVNFTHAILVTVLQQAAPQLLGPWFILWTDISRYIYIMEPILALFIIKQLQQMFIAILKRCFHCA